MSKCKDEKVKLIYPTCSCGQCTASISDEYEEYMKEWQEWMDAPLGIPRPTFKPQKNK